MVMWRYWWKSLTLNHPTTKFGGFRHCVSEGGRFVICHMILLLGTQITSKGHVTCGSASRRTIFLPNLAIDLLRVKTKHILFTHVIWRDYLTEWSCDVMDGRSSVYITTLPSTTLPSVMVIGIVVVEIVIFSIFHMIYDIGQNIVDKSSNLSNIGFSMECKAVKLTFRNFVGQLSKKFLCVVAWVLFNQLQVFAGFSSNFTWNGKTAWPNGRTLSRWVATLPSLMAISVVVVFSRSRARFYMFVYPCHY